MEDRLSFTYGEFYDFPRMLAFEFQDRWYLMRSFFDEVNGDYADLFDVYVLPFRTEDELKRHEYFWRDVSKYDHLGQVTLHEIGFDQSRLRSIGSGFLRKLLATRHE